MAQILVIEDESKIADVISAYLKKEGYSPYVENNGKSALALFHRESFDLVILDLMLPDISGEEICREICQKDRRFSYVRHKKNLGGYRSAMFLFDSCDSEYITFVGGHDQVHPTYLQKHVHVLADLWNSGLVTWYTFAIAGPNSLFFGLTLGGFKLHNSLQAH